MSEPQRVKLMPKKGTKVRKPDGSFLADDGESVVHGTYWRRRLAHGDVVAPDEKDSAARRGPLTSQPKGDDA